MHPSHSTSALQQLPRPSQSRATSACRNFEFPSRHAHRSLRGFTYNHGLYRPQQQARRPVQQLSNRRATRHSNSKNYPHLDRQSRSLLLHFSKLAALGPTIGLVRIARPRFFEYITCCSIIYNSCSASPNIDRRITTDSTHNSDRSSAHKNSKMLQYLHALD